MTDMPILETTRLRIRPFVMEDLQDVYHLLDVELADADLRTEKNPYPEPPWLQVVGVLENRETFLVRT